MKENIWDVFISHASEDKAEVARPLANMLAETGIKVWLDEAELTLGASLRGKIDEALSKSQFGVVILSYNFFNKQWPKSELNGLFAKDIQGENIILPVWHNIRYEEVLAYSPLLADRFSVSTKRGLLYVRDQIVKSIRLHGKNKRIEQPLYAGKISKKKLMEFPEGSILMSNAWDDKGLRPLYVDELRGLQLRVDLWQKIKNLGAQNSIHYIFSSAAGYRAHLNSRDIFDPIDEDKRWRR